MQSQLRASRIPSDKIFKTIAAVAGVYVVAFMYLGLPIEFDETRTLFTQPKNELTAKYVKGQFG